MIRRPKHSYGKTIIPVLFLAVIVFVFSSGSSPLYSADCQEIVSSQESGIEAAFEKNGESNKAVPQCEEPGPNWLLIMLIVGGVLLAAFIFCSTAALHPYFQSTGSPDEKKEKIGCGDTAPAGKRVLVAYQTRHGSTTSVAMKIGEVLNDNGFYVDVRPLQSITGNEDLAKYDAYVVGSGVIWSRLMPEFEVFIEKYKHLWPQKPHALFMVCLTIQRETEANWGRVKSYIETSIKSVPEFDPIERMGFAGAVDMKKLTFWEWFGLSLFFLVTPQKGGDHRDMNKVAAWAEKLSEGLKAKLVKDQD